jgi:acyl-CoA synthetase (AMP-forming)/AMP-acid ligase II
MSQENHLLKTLGDLLRRRSCAQPAKEAFRWVSEGQIRELPITYQMLDEDAQRIAGRLIADCLPGHRVALLYPPGLDFLKGLFGCFYAGAVAIPTSPPEHNRENRRLKSILSDASPTAVLTIAKYEQRTKQFLLDNGFDGILCIATDALEDMPSIDFPMASPQDLAYLQYTSGSTSNPKGVMLTHHNVIENLRQLDMTFKFSPESICASWLPHYHDMGLVYGLLEPMFKGIPAILMSPHAFVRTPFRWLEVISQYRVTHSAAPNFAYDLCVSRCGMKLDLQIDLSCWDVAISGAEPVRARTIEQFTECFAKYGFHRKTFCPGYGLAEATLVVTGTPPDREPRYLHVDSECLRQNQMRQSSFESTGSTFVGCGQPMLADGVVIVDPERKYRVAECQIGEIWVASESVSNGYWGHPELSREIFHAYLDDGKGPFLRTGDLGAIIQGELYITGRIKDLIIIRGQNLYPQDIERTLEASHPHLAANASAAFAVQSFEAEAVVVAAEVSRNRTDEGINIASAIRQAIAAEHGIQISAVALLQPGTLAKTSSGKIQRQSCRNSFLDGSLPAIETYKFHDGVYV